MSFRISHSRVSLRGWHPCINCSMMSGANRASRSSRPTVVDIKPSARAISTTLLNAPVSSRACQCIARAMYWHDLLDTGTFKSVVEIARAEGLMPTTVGRLLRLARLAPDIVEQFMRGCQPRRLTLLWLMRNDIPALWPEQRQMLERFR